jgi:hypothetical protein
VQVFVETHLAGGRIMMIDQRPRIIEDHLLRDPAEVPERALRAVQPGRLPLMPEGPDKRPPQIAQGRDKQMHPHRGTPNRHRDRPKVDLRLLARRRLSKRRQARASARNAWRRGATARSTLAATP